MNRTQNSPKRRQEKQLSARRKHWNHMQVNDRPSPDAPSLTQAIIVQMVYWTWHMTWPVLCHDQANVMENSNFSKLVKMQGITVLSSKIAPVPWPCANPVIFLSLCNVAMASVCSGGWSSCNDQPPEHCSCSVSCQPVAGQQGVEGRVRLW